jgi:MoaA/NifB/PqqE/SkfB family radical SAM enzyme
MDIILLLMKSKEWGGILLRTSCLNHCLFCGVVPKQTKEEIEKDEFKILKNLKDFRAQEIKNIEISGNDPIEYEFITPLIRHIKKMGFHKVQLSTHGVGLDDAIFAKEIIDSGLDILRIPLYGSKSCIHDSVTQNEGSFFSTINGIKRIKQSNSNISFTISSLIMKQNKDDLFKICDLVKELNIENFYFSIPLVANSDYSYILSFSELSLRVIQIFEYSKKIGLKVDFTDIPFCFFGFNHSSINNHSLPPNLGKHFQPPNQFKTEIKDMPSYRLKEKLDFCKDCKCNNHCDGFNKNYLNFFGKPKFRPILE